MQRLSIIWSNPLSDYHKVAASNQYVLPVLTYFMWTQTWTLADLQQLVREARKVVVENGGNHPVRSVGQLYISRQNNGKGLRSFESEYKSTKIKEAVKLFENSDTTMSAVRKFEKKAVQTGCHPIIKDAEKYCKIPKISPGAYIFQRPFLRGLFLEGLI